jgi:exopolysaccharide biosynthesis polyprenyl glycosylphosphotransferase
MRFFYRVKQCILIGGDILSFSIGFGIAFTLRNGNFLTTLDIDRHFTLFFIVFCLWIVVNYINGLYDLVRLNNDRIFYRRFGETAGISLLIGIIFFYLVPERAITPKTILLLTVLFGYSISLLFRLIFQTIFGTGKLTPRVVFVGYTKEIHELVNILTQNPKQGYKVVACIDPSNTIRSQNMNGIDVYNSVKAIRPAISTHKADLVVIAPHVHENEDVVRELYELLFWPVELMDLTSFYELNTGRIPSSVFSESWFLGHIRQSAHPPYDSFRILVDYAAALGLVLVFLILFPLIAIAIKLTSPGPIFFKQKRVGRYRRVFNLYKFRSMYALSPDGSAEIGKWEFAQKKDKRITAIGKILRKTRIDEIPQCFNLLKGDITLIGPRPERPEIVEEIEQNIPYFHLRHVVKPGLTGWAVLHQNYTDHPSQYEKKLQYDLYYIKNRSLLLDLSIVLRTINLILRFRGQ